MSSIIDALNSLHSKKAQQTKEKDNGFVFSFISDAVFSTTLYRAGHSVEEIEKLLTEPKDNRDKILEDFNL
jgi:hypothetical protein